RRMRQTGREVAALIALLEIDARAVRKPRLDAGDEVALRARGTLRHEIALLVLERVTHVEARALRVHVARADLAARAQATVRELRVDLEPVRDAILAARADAPVLVAVAVERRRFLREAVGAEARLRVVADLHDRVGTLALLLRQRHGRGRIEP